MGGCLIERPEDLIVKPSISVIVPTLTDENTANGDV